MNEVTKALEQVRDSSIGTPEVEAFQMAAERWATFALRNFTGDHLVKALDVSRAMAEYAAWHVERRK